MKDKGPAELFAVPLLLAFLDGALVGDGERGGSPTRCAVLVVQLSRDDVISEKA